MRKRCGHALAAPPDNLFNADMKLPISNDLTPSYIGMSN